MMAVLPPYQAPTLRHGMAGFLYICEYLGITPQDFFNVGSVAPQKAKEVLGELEKLTPSQADHVMLIIKDIVENK